MPLQQRHAVIEQSMHEDPTRSVRQMCRSLHVNRAWWYTARKRPLHSEADLDLRDAIKQIVLEFPGDGYRRVTHALDRYWLSGDPAGNR